MDKQPIDVRVGSLVRWTHPGAESLGVVLSVHNDRFSANIRWVASEGYGSGIYPLAHQYLELLSK